MLLVRGLACRPVSLPWWASPSCPPTGRTRTPLHYPRILGMICGRRVSPLRGIRRATVFSVTSQRKEEESHLRGAVVLSPQRCLRPTELCLGAVRASSSVDFRGGHHASVCIREESAVPRGRMPRGPGAGACSCGTPLPPAAVLPFVPSVKH